MNCHDSKQLIMEYLDGELAPAEKHRLEEHLAGCDACQAELAEQERVIRAVRTLPRVAAPAGLGAKVAAEIARENAPGGHWRQWMFRYGAMAASILIVVCAFGVYMKTQQKPAPQRANDTARVSSAAAPSAVDPSAMAPSAAPAAEIKAPAEPRQPLADGRKRAGDDYEYEYGTAKAAEKPAPAGPATEAKTKLDSGLLAKDARPHSAARPEAEVAQVQQGAEQSRGIPAAEQPVMALGQTKADAFQPKGKAGAIAGAKLERKAGYAEAAGFDLVIEADDVSKCINDLSVFLDARGYTVVARIRALRSVVLAEAKPAPADKLEEAANAPQAGTRQNAAQIAAQIAASGRFSVVSDSTLAYSGQTLDAKQISSTPLKESKDAPADRQQLDISRKKSEPAGSIAILIIDRAAKPPVAADADAAREPAATKAKPAGMETGK
ncbi:MAG TPA: zf-HC2 domain-containing protein [Planctomycetota bacterium]|nr:zf-HC2 domain-containing protein [Planctomycetota bacterium]